VSAAQQSQHKCRPQIKVNIKSETTIATTAEAPIATTPRDKAVDENKLRSQERRETRVSKWEREREVGKRNIETFN